MRQIVLTLLALACVVPASAQEALLFVSSRAGDRLTPKRTARFTTTTSMPSSSVAATFRLSRSVTHQVIAGFGGTFLEAGMLCLNTLERDKQEAVLRALFDPKKGAGLSAMKTVIAGTDFMSAGPWYSYAEAQGDVELKSFSIDRDLRPNGLVTFIERARRYGSFILQAPMDYPPDWMLYDVEKNQDVDPRAIYYLAHFSRFVRPGSVRIGTTGGSEGIRCLAFHTPDRRIVTELLNSRTTDARVSVECDGRILKLVSPAGSITTASWKPTSRQGAVVNKIGYKAVPAS